MTPVAETIIFSSWMDPMKADQDQHLQQAGLKMQSQMNVQSLRSLLIMLSQRDDIKRDWNNISM